MVLLNRIGQIQPKSKRQFSQVIFAQALSGFKVQVKDAESARNLINSAKDLEKTGAFMIVMECIPEILASRITRELSIPTIRIGAGTDCGSQVFVYREAVGFFERFILSQNS